MASSFDQIRMVFDFGPTVWTHRNMNSGPALFTVLEGEMTLRQGGIDKVYKEGESWTGAPRQVYQVGNATGVKTRVVGNNLVHADQAAATKLGHEIRNAAVAPAHPWVVESDWASAE